MDCSIEPKDEVSGERPEPRLVVLTDGSFTVSLEPACWAAMEAIRAREAMEPETLWTMVNNVRMPRQSLAAAARLLAMRYWMAITVAS